MPKRIFWKQMIIPEKELSKTLTALNFQPNKFHVVALTSKMVLVLYVDKEVKNVEY